MPDLAPGTRLTHEGAMGVVRAAIAKADELSVPQCIAVTDAGGRLLAFVRMDGAKFLSIRTSLRKAMTAASQRAPSGQATHAIHDGDGDHAVRIGLATAGRLTRLEGGFPIVVGDDVAVAEAGVAAIAGAKRW
jgi:glc operon protein GlcG